MALMASFCSVLRARLSTKYEMERRRDRESPVTLITPRSVSA